MRWYAQDEANQEESEQNEVDGMKKGANSTGEVMHILKSGWWIVMRTVPGTDCRARVTADEERVLLEDWTWIRYVGSQVGWSWELCRWVTGVDIHSSMRSLILNQCRDLRVGVIWEHLGALTTMRARQFWIYWKKVMAIFFQHAKLIKNGHHHTQIKEERVWYFSCLLHYQGLCHVDPK